MGFGLHYCANALIEINGRITLESHGQRTLVTLTLPAADEG